MLAVKGALICLKVSMVRGDARRLVVADQARSCCRKRQSLHARRAQLCVRSHATKAHILDSLRRGKQEWRGQIWGKGGGKVGGKTWVGQGLNRGKSAKEVGAEEGVGLEEGPGSRESGGRCKRSGENAGNGQMGDASPSE